MGHDQATNKKADYGHQGGLLKIAQSGNRMARGASPGIAGTKADQKTGDDQDGQPFKRQNGIQAENLGG